MWQKSQARILLNFHVRQVSLNFCCYITFVTNDKDCLKFLNSLSVYVYTYIHHVYYYILMHTPTYICIHPLMCIPKILLYISGCWKDLNSTHSSKSVFYYLVCGIQIWETELDWEFFIGPLLYKLYLIWWKVLNLAKKGF